MLFLLMILTLGLWAVYTTAATVMAIHDWLSKLDEMGEPFDQSELERIAWRNRSSRRKHKWGNW
jgi:predicted glycosyltransferase